MIYSTEGHRPEVAIVRSIETESVNELYHSVCDHAYVVDMAIKAKQQ